MPRIRTIKPEFFTSDTVTALPIRARLTWIGMWTHCDDHGRCRNNVKLIKAAVWPLDDVTLRDVAEDVEVLTNAGLVFEYEACGKSYLQVTGWSEHQKVDRPSKSPIPPPPSTANGSYPQKNPRDTLASTREGLDQEGKGKEGKGRERARAQDTPPPKTCPKHPTGTSDPCGPCKDARLAHDQWQAAKNARVRDSPRCPHHPDQTRDHCGPCRSEQLARSTP